MQPSLAYLETRSCTSASKDLPAPAQYMLQMHDDTAHTMPCREREAKRTEMRKNEEAAETAARGVARMRSELDALARPIQQYIAAGSADRLRAVTERLAQNRQKLAAQNAELGVRPWPAEYEACCWHYKLWPAG